MYLVLTRMPGGVTVGDSGLCCCVPCPLNAITSLCLLNCLSETDKMLNSALFNQTKQDRMQVFKGILYFKDTNNTNQRNSCCWLGSSRRQCVILLVWRDSKSNLLVWRDSGSNLLVWRDSRSNLLVLRGSRSNLLVWRF